MLDCNYQKGADFEAYIRELFNETYFKTLEWHKAVAKAPQEKLDHKMSNPDLTISLKLNSVYPFAVECKWRKQLLDDGNMRWDTIDNQLNKYLAFQEEFNNPVFMAIGLGGMPKTPEALYILPLEKVADAGCVNITMLTDHQKKINSRFFYDTIQKKLQ